MDQPFAIEHDADMAGKEHQITSLVPPPASIGRHRLEQLPKFGTLHVAVARRGDTGWLFAGVITAEAANEPGRTSDPVRTCRPGRSIAAFPAAST